MGPMPPVLSSPFRNLSLGVLVLLMISAAATLAYVLQGWSIADAVYMVVVTVFSVGYREAAPVDTSALRAITPSAASA